MNKNDRKTLQTYVDKIEEIKKTIEEMKENEEEKYGNMPEGLQESERGEAMQNAIDQMEYGIDSLQEAIDNLTGSEHAAQIDLVSVFSEDGVMVASGRIPGGKWS